MTKKTILKLLLLLVSVTVAMVYLKVVANKRTASSKKHLLEEKQDAPIVIDILEVEAPDIDVEVEAPEVDLLETDVSEIIVNIWSSPAGMPSQVFKKAGGKKKRKKLSEPSQVEQVDETEQPAVKQEDEM